MMSETYETLKFERDGAVAIVTLHRPQAGNAIEIRSLAIMLNHSNAGLI
jgi:enoyl-CoA hydratase/carnithine racemase